ncbi:MAG: sulfatase-like hydrolase/transferase, partial [Methanosarcinaceae archaeon]|nr:sulfatase-like hydrolase/transferase [Methanosarcinaceae archaeon]
MNRRTFLQSAISAGALSVLPGCFSEKTKNAEKFPLNFLFILVDDMGFKDLSCYGSDFYETPNIDRLASEGMKFTNAYAASPVCSPTRASIQSGKYPARTGINFILNDGLVDSSYKLYPPHCETEMKLEEVTIAE